MGIIERTSLPIAHCNGFVTYVLYVIQKASWVLLKERVFQLLHIIILAFSLMLNIK
jgi:hypothetical protein